MRVVVANLTSGGLSGGYRKYLERLMPLMARDPRVSALTVFVPDRAEVTMDVGLDVRAWPNRDARRGYAELAHEVATLAPDVVFVPTARYAAFGGIPVVAMVRNMEPLVAPFGGNPAFEALKNVARRLEARRACQRASRIVAVSEFVRDFILSRWRVDPARVGVVYHGVDRPQDGVPHPGRSATTIFTAGSIRPARGLEDVIRALPLIDGGVRLVVAGQIDRGFEAYAARLRRLSERLGVAARISWAGQLDSPAMTAAFRECAVFVMTSRVEACPNVVLEAMVCGTPSVSVDQAPMPEFFGDAALYYRAGDVRTLASRLRGLLATPADRVRLGGVARAHAAAFVWDATCRRTIHELEQAVS